MAVHAERQLHLRRMAPSDLDAVARIERVAHRHPWSADLIRRELDHDWSTVLLAVETEQLAGAPSAVERIGGYIIFWLVHDEVHVLNVATDPELRRRGFGEALMHAAEAAGRGRGAVLSTLEVRRSNAPAIGLYRKLGYRQVGVRPRYYAEDGEDALVMVKDLPR